MQLYWKGTTDGQMLRRALQTNNLIQSCHSCTISTSQHSDWKSSQGWHISEWCYQWLFLHESWHELVYQWIPHKSRQLLMPFVNAGIFTCAHMSSTLSWISKHSTRSPGRRLSKNVLFSVTNMSLALPPQPSEINEATPLGVIPIRYLIVLWCV
jgi:hypothetical protein